MLGDTEAIATVAVRDLKKAAAFYEGTLGLKVKAKEGDEVISYATGSTVLNVYRSEFAGTNKATAVCWGSGGASTRSPGRSRPRASPSSATTCPGSSARATCTSATACASPGSRIPTATS